MALTSGAVLLQFISMLVMSPLLSKKRPDSTHTPLIFLLTSSDSASVSGLLMSVDMRGRTLLGGVAHDAQGYPWRPVLGSSQGQASRQSRPVSGVSLPRLPFFAMR